MMIEVEGRSAFAYTGGRPFDPARPVVVFVHGAQHDHSVWILQSRYLAHHGYAVLALDLPGHGQSAGPPLASVEDCARWLLALLAQLGVQGATVVGHSMGSLIALEAASRGGSAIGRIVLVATAYPMQVSPALLEATRTDEGRAIDLINIWSHSQAFGGFAHKPGNPGPGFDIVWQNKRLMERQKPGVLANDFAACNAYARGAEAAAAVKVPALFILAEKDAMTAARSGRELAASIAGAQVVVVPAAGHAVMAEAPDAVRKALVDFLARPLSARAA